MKVKQFLLIIITLLFSLAFSNTKIFAQDETLEARVDKILEEKDIIPEGSDIPQHYQKLELLITKGSFKESKITIENGNIPMVNNQAYQINDKVILSYGKDPEGNDSFTITDYVRRDSLSLLLILFVVSTIAVAKWRGILSLIGMGVSFLVIFSFILPKILDGSDPVIIAILGSLIIIPLSFFLSHGFSKKTYVAIAGTFIALIITGVLSNFFIEITKLTGFVSEEAGFLQAYKPGLINMKGLLLAGIIIGALGVLDDITISQSAVVFQLKEANEKFKFDELYQRAMKIGQDHISSMINTLILVYTGAALPLLLLFINNPHPFSEVINYEIIADEVVRTLVGSIGLILAVPITTIIASFVATQKHKPKFHPPRP